MTSFARDENDSGLSVKLAINGNERYRIGSRTHNVTAGRFLVINTHQSFECRVKSNEVVEGMCFYLDPEAIQDIRNCTTFGHSNILDQKVQASNNDLFIEKVFGLSETELGNFLQKMLPVLRNPSLRTHINFEEFFLQMAEMMVKSEKGVKQLIGNLKNEKPSTREELYRRLSLARTHIDEHFLEELNLDQLADVAMTSKYHFLRCFKEIYHCAPYQYVIQKRLAFAIELLKSREMNLTEIATETGFTDRRAFNKSFKRHFGVLPGEFLSQA